MKGNSKISSPSENQMDSVFLPPILDDHVVLTTSGPVREALERHMVVDQMDEHEVVFERRFMGRWVYKEE